MKNNVKMSLLFLAISALTACGGGTGSSNPSVSGNNVNSGVNAGTHNDEATPLVAVTPAPDNITILPEPTPTTTPEPTQEPTVSPTLAPVPVPTLVPTSSPTITPQPGATPTPNTTPSKEPVSESGDLLEKVKASIATRDNNTVEAIEPYGFNNPSNVQRVESIISSSDWDFLFAERADEYSYSNFLKAVGKFPALCGDYDDGRDAEAICRKTLATMFAHFAQETGGHTAHWETPEWRQGLVHVREMGWDETMRDGYNGECNPSTWQGETWPCGTFENGDYKSYFGRGAKQLSYNYNYGPFSDAMFGDVRTLLDNPELVADTWLNLASAIFFYVYPQPPKPSMLHVVDGTWQPNEADLANGLVPGFGVTTQIINGGIECGGSVEVQQSLNRISYYQSFADYLSVPIAEDEVLGCAGMKQFDEAGSGALNIYWEKDWSYNATNPQGLSYACKLVGYQTPFSALKDGDYEKCVEYHFDITPENTPTPTPTVAPQPTPTAEPMPEPSTLPENNTSGIEQPGTVNIAWMAETYEASEISIGLTWNMYWGVNGNVWYAYVDGQQVNQTMLTPNGNNAQTGSVNITVSGTGTHTLTVKLCNEVADAAAACSEDNTVITLGSENSQPNHSGTNSGNSGSNDSNTTTEPEVTPEANMYGEFNKTYQQTSGKVIASYFVEWGVYGRNYHVQDIPASNLTHILFGFIAICGDNPHASGGAQAAIASECTNKQNYEVTMVDRFANLEKTYPGDTWIDDVSSQNYNGNFGQLKKLKQQYPHLKVLPSIGGWTMSTPFYAMAKDANKRTIFVNSAIDFIKKYDFFDGIDIDWEYPVFGGTDPELSSGDDREGYTLLMRDLREKMNELSNETGRTYELTSAVGAAPERINAVDYTQATQYMDYVFLMSYDFMGAWANTTGHHTPLYDNQGLYEGFNTADAVQNMLTAGVPANKLVVGAAFYGRGWKGTTNSNAHAPELFPLYGEATGPAAGTWEAGVQDYRDLYNNYIGSGNTGINGFEVHYDEIAEAAYLWNPLTGEFITYDSPRSVKAKADYVKQHNLAGMLSWEIDSDNGLLLNALNEGLGNDKVE